MEDAEIIERAVSLLVSGEENAAREILRKLPQDDPIERPVVAATTSVKAMTVVPRPSFRIDLAVPVLKRGGWRCHYCGRKLVVAGVIALVGKLCAEQFPFPAGHHMPADRTHPAAIRVYPNIDHIYAGARGGDWLDEDNLVAACTPCNERKSDREGWVTVAPAQGSWWGLTEHYRKLAERGGRIGQTDRTWLRALEL